MAFVDSPADSQVLQGYQFFKVFDEHQLEYVILAKGDSDDVYMVGKLAAFQIQNLLVAYKERYDKDNFIKNLLLDNLLLVDIYNRAKKLHIDTSVKRVVFLIETKNEKDVNALETVKGLFVINEKKSRWYKVKLKKTQTLKLTLNASTDKYGFWYQITDSKGKKIVSNQELPRGKKQFKKKLKAGTYYLEIAPTGATGSYSVKWN